MIRGILFIFSFLAVVFALAVPAVAELDKKEYDRIEKKFKTAISEGNRPEAAAALGELAVDNTEKSAKFILEMALTANMPEEIFAAAKNALAAFFDEKAVEFLLSASAAKDYRPRMLLADVFGGMNDEKTAQQLVKTLSTDPDERVLRRAVKAVKNRLYIDAIPALIAVLEKTEKQKGLLYVETRLALIAISRGEDFKDAAEWQHFWKYDGKAVVLENIQKQTPKKPKADKAKPGVESPKKDEPKSDADSKPKPEKKDRPKRDPLAGPAPEEPPAEPEKPKTDPPAGGNDAPAPEKKDEPKKGGPLAGGDDSKQKPAPEEGAKKDGNDKEDGGPKLTTTSQKNKPTFFETEIDSNRVVFVMDVSDSMKNKDADLETTKLSSTGPLKRSELPEDRMRINRVKEQLRKCVAALDESTCFNIITFNNLVKSWETGLVMATADAKQKAFKFIEAFKHDGQTHTDEALKRAFQDQEIDTIILLSDGAPFKLDPKAAKDDKKNSGISQALIDNILEWVRQANRFRRIRINTFGFDAVFKAKDGPICLEFLKKMAAENDGTYTNIK